MKKCIEDSEKQDSFLKTLKTRRAKLIGRVLRRNSLLSRLIESAIEGNNSRGRPPLDYIGQIVTDVDCRSYRKLKRYKQNKTRRTHYYILYFTYVPDVLVLVFFL